MNQPSKDEHKYKYSGGFATYPQQHVPIAVYSKEANKTFFVYGGRPKERNTLLMMVAYYDHAGGDVPRPAVLLDKKTDDAHDNPVLSIDGQGHLWVFSNAHGTQRPAFIHRSLKPYDISAFELVQETNFSYGQPWWVSGKGFFFLHTRYKQGRGLWWMSSPDGRSWSAPSSLSHLELGHYQVSCAEEGRVGTVFDVHPKPLGLNARTNLYYMETGDFGGSWTTLGGDAIARDYRKDGLLVYLKDLRFDEGKPVALYLTSKGYEAGPKNGPRQWRTTRWTGTAWETRDFTTSDHNYDHGSLYVEKGLWRVIATTDPGATPHGTGGDVVLWESPDRGATWTRVKTLTSGPRNHAYPRRPLHAHPGFYALWADGDPHQPSESSLYFCDRDGAVFRLPARMDGDRARPDPVRR
jgi:hypothetical protein